MMRRASSHCTCNGVDRAAEHTFLIRTVIIIHVGSSHRAGSVTSDLGNGSTVIKFRARSIDTTRDGSDALSKIGDLNGAAVTGQQLSRTYIIQLIYC